MPRARPLDTRSDAYAWWQKHRRLYNLALVIAGIAAFFCYGAVLEHLIYGLGSICEEIVRPRNPARWRSVAFTLGTAFSVILPFSIPLLVALKFSARQ